MRANIAPIVNDLKKVTVEQVAFEAITNSLHANATNIEVYFCNSEQSFIKEEDFFIHKIKIVDNGEGFNSGNIESFKTYRSTHKKDLGAKGIGRFLFLKLFTQVDIKSLSKEIKFTDKFGVEEKDTKKMYKKTEVLIHYLVKGHQEKDYKIRKSDFGQEIKDHFLSYFKLLETQHKSVKIKIYFNDDLKYIVNSEENPCFKEDFFEVKNHKFNFLYLINDNNVKSYDGFYCAGNRVVLKNSQLDYRRKFKSFYGIKILFLLSSDYLDKNVNDERDDFNIKPAQFSSDDLFGDLSWRDIHDSLSKKIKSVCKGYGIDVEKQAQENLKQSIDNAPFLVAYLRNNDSGLSSEELIKKAKEKYEADKIMLRKPESKDNDDYKLKLNIVVQAELAEYIFDREKIINKLKNIVDEELIEKEIHNLFMQQYTSNNDPLNYRSNNLWLFDDRFMTYDKVFSEVQVKEIFPELANVTKRLDLFTIVSNTYKKEKITDIVLIELKKPDNTITPAEAEQQLLEYARYVNSSRQDNKIRIWAYAFLKFNADVEERLKDKSYNHIPTHSQYPIYYYYHARPNMIINFMDYYALADDAYTRNQTFINILKGKKFK